METTIKDFIQSFSFGKKIYQDYYAGNIVGFNHDKRVHDTARAKCKNLLQRLSPISEVELVTACLEAWSGRLDLEEGKLVYTAGQFYNIEAPQALASVLEQVELNRDRLNKNN